MLSTFVIFLALVSASIGEPVSKCAGGFCAPVIPETCIEQGLAYVPADYVEHCCDRCVKPEDIIEPKICDPRICPRVSCFPKTYDKCAPNQVLVPTDQLCYCCTDCAHKKGTRKCGVKYCDKIYESNYSEPPPEQCLSQGLAFVPRDFDCTCINTCQNISDVTEKITCDPPNCSKFDCRKHTIEDCNARQVLVPAGGCYCCDSCVYKKV